MRLTLLSYSFVFRLFSLTILYRFSTSRTSTYTPKIMNGPSNITIFVDLHIHPNLLYPLKSISISHIRSIFFLDQCSC